MANFTQNASPFLQALGGFFGGYGQDQQLQQQRARQRALDAQTAESQGMAREAHNAQMLNYQSEVDARKRAAEQAAKSEQVLGEHYQRAIDGDKQSQALIVAVRPDLANDFMPKKPPAPNMHSANTVNLQTGDIEDVYEDGRRVVVRKATPDELAKAKHVPDAAGGGMTEQRQFLRSQALQSDYKNNETIKNAYGVSRAVSGLKAALSGDSPMDDLSVIYETVKLFDPNSAVKDGEIKLARSANSLPGQIGLMVQHWNSGRMITPEMRQQVAGLLERKISESSKAVAPVQSESGAIARRYGVAADSAYIAPDPFRGVRSASPTAGPKPSLEERVQQLKQQGISKDQARLQLKREGYNLGAP